MSKNKKQLYVVVHGRRPGIFNKWFGEDGAADQVEGFPEAIYKGFYSREEALEWLKEFGDETLSKIAPELLEAVDGITPRQDTESPEEALKAGKVVIYTDGGAITNPGPGGYGIVLKYKDNTKELSGGFRSSTNNRMEISACIEALRALKKKCSVVIYCDSKYVVESMSHGRVKRWQMDGWMRNADNEAENADLWKRLLDLCSQHEVTFRWLRGHAGNRDNERCDQLAMAAARRKDLPADAGYEDRGERSSAGPSSFPGPG